MTYSLTGVGLYSLPQVARILGADVRSVRRWMLGYSRKQSDGYLSSPPLWRTQLSDADLSEPAIGFRDLLELRLVNEFVKHGVNLRVIRATAEAARSIFGSDYPLTMKRFLSDGRRIFAEAVTSTGETHLFEPVGGQLAFSEIVKPFLYLGIEYDGEIARRWIR